MSSQIRIMKIKRKPSKKRKVVQYARKPQRGGLVIRHFHLTMANGAGVVAVAVGLLSI